jgi:hypothetical protein
MKNNLISEVDRIKNLMLINEASGGVWDSVIAGLKSITRNDSVVVRELDDILTNVKAGRINPTDVQNRLSILGMSLEGNTLVRYVESMLMGPYLDDLFKNQFKQISKGLKDGSIELVDAKNALSQLGQTNNIDDLLEKYADELTSSSSKINNLKNITSPNRVKKFIDEMEILYSTELRKGGKKSVVVRDKLNQLKQLTDPNISEASLNAIREKIVQDLQKIDTPSSNWLLQQIKQNVGVKFAIGYLIGGISLTILVYVITSFDMTVKDAVFNMMKIMENYYLNYSNLVHVHINLYY